MKIIGKLYILFLSFLFSALVFFAVGGSALVQRVPLAAAAESVRLITTREELVSAIANAEEDSVLLVGDIDFGLPDLPLAVVVNKSIVIQSGKEDGSRAFFTNGAFKVEGLTETLSVTFENIDFCGSNEEAGSFLTENESYFADGVYVPPQIKRHMFSAITLTGNVEAAVSDCRFHGYVNTNGGALYADNAGMNKQLSLRLDHVRFNGNAAFLGGALYVGEGTELNALACTFRENEAKNGGALYIRRSLTHLDGCVLAENDAQSVGGGMYVSTVENTPVTLLNTSVYQNVADNGGGVGLIPNMGNNGKLNLFFCTYYGNVTKNEGCSFDLVEQPYVNAFGCVFIDDALPETYNETEEGEEYYTPWEAWYPNLDNGYNYVALTAQSEGDGVSVLEENYRLALLGDSLSTIPKDALPDVLSLVGNSQGAFEVGSNARALHVTVRFEEEQTVFDHVFDYGQRITLPTLEKVGYSFVGWTAENGEPINLEEIFFGASADTLILLPVYTPNTYTLTLVSVQGTSQSSVVYGTQTELPSLEKDGYDFVGWFTQEEGAGTRWESLDVYLADGDTTLYAHFKKHFPLGAVLGIGFGLVAFIGIAYIIVLAWRRREKDLEKQLLAQVADVAVADVGPDISMLSGRENQVLVLLLQGKKRSEIAGELYVSEETIKKQITSIYRKLDVKTRSELFAKFR